MNVHSSRAAARASDRPAPGPAGLAPEPDLSTLSPAVAETCSALTLSLWEGDGPAASRLFGFLLDQLPDRRSTVDDVLAPLLAREHARPGSRRDRRCFVDTCSALLAGLRQPVSAPAADAVLLHAGTVGLPSLLVQLVAVLLDDAHVPAVVLLDADDDSAVHSTAVGGHRAVCVGAADEDGLRRSESLIRSLRQRDTAVVVVGPAVATRPAVVSEVGAVAGSAHPGGAADLLARLRGPLTQGEADVLRMAADGYTNLRIAHELGISLSAVKARLESGYARLGAADRTHAVAIALRQHWIR